MKRVCYPSPDAEEKIRVITERGHEFRSEDLDTVSKILADVKLRGDEALIEYTNRFDAPDLKVSDLIVSDEEMAAAEDQVDSSFLSALNRSAHQIEEFHKKQLRNSWISTSRPGVMLGQLVNPVDAAGVYVPGAKGGLTPLVSSVLMGVIPAKIAGVKHISMVTPPTREGTVNPHLLVAAKKVGADIIYKTGSAWAVAGLAYGTNTIKKVDVIVGPGNIYVTLAKKMVSGTVGIDMIAGPSEILVIADESANPDFIAADLLSQAEHDILASSVLITNSEQLADKVDKAVAVQLAHLERKEIAEKSLAAFGIIMIVPDIETAINLSNRIAPEHLEIQVQEPFEYLGQIRNAGAVFIGEYTPEPVGDYVAGPNHVLPTGGTARFSSALSVDNFVKQTSLLHYSKAAFDREADDIMRIANVEGLGAHAGSVAVRCKDGNPEA
ncbi:MAG: histidinol dehydrogenase [Desulfobacteraceae bacterium]|jgi:histidinol dehydrogenase|nr:histidinol dehydrogenase [Desulfobacteraceae bacterium]